MFDNPERELARLHARLLETEEPPLEELYEDDAEAALDEVKELLRQSDWEEIERPPLCESYRETDSEEAVSAPPEKQKKEKKSGLALPIVIELLGIATLLAWWLLWE